MWNKIILRLNIILYLTIVTLLLFNLFAIDYRPDSVGLGAIIYWGSAIITIIILILSTTLSNRWPGSIVFNSISFIINIVIAFFWFLLSEEPYQKLREDDCNDYMNYMQIQKQSATILKSNLINDSISIVMNNTYSDTSMKEIKNDIKHLLVGRWESWRIQLDIKIDTMIVTISCYRPFYNTQISYIFKYDILLDSSTFQNLSRYNEIDKVSCKLLLRGINHDGYIIWDIFTLCKQEMYVGMKDVDMRTVRITTFEKQ